MKLFHTLCTITFLSVLIAGCTTTPTAEKPAAQKTTQSGVLMPLKSQTGDATHTLKTDTGSLFVNSYSVDLNQYNQQQVTLTGEMSGDTLFVDDIHKK